MPSGCTASLPHARGKEGLGSPKACSAQAADGGVAFLPLPPAAPVAVLVPQPQALPGQSWAAGALCPQVLPAASAQPKAMARAEQGGAPA